MDNDGFARARALVSRASQVVVMSGAGISTDSGIPDFRGPNGLWTKDPEAERASNLSSYLGDPDLRRKAWRNRLEHPIWTAEPNAGHLAVTDLAHQERLRSVLTQNIDGLHQRAGTAASLVVELHGTMHQVVCWGCHAASPMLEILARVRSGEDDPPCELCGGILKSATISFGQALDPGTLARADAAVADCDLVLAVGSTLSVHPAAGYVPMAARHGASIVIVNGSPTAYDHTADAVVRGPISEILPALVAPS